MYMHKIRAILLNFVSFATRYNMYLILINFNPHNLEHNTASGQTVIEIADFVSDCYI